MRIDRDAAPSRANRGKQSGEFSMGVAPESIAGKQHTSDAAYTSFTAVRMVRSDCSLRSAPSLPHQQSIT